MRILKWIGLVLLGISIVLTALLYFSTFHPPDVQPAQVHSPASLPVLQPGQRLKVLSWNVQFMAGNQNNHFFYDDGDDPWPDEKTVQATIKQVAQLITEQDPDVVLLQEVDDEATRTHNSDQTQALRELLPQYPAYSETFYWKAAYVPHPAINGRVGMKLVVLSKYALGSATRIALPMITSDDIVRRQFNLKRAIQQVLMPVEGGNDVVMMNTHLSAFAKGTNTMTLQVEKVLDTLSQLPPQTPWVLGGDFNLLPNEASIAALDEARSEYNDQGTELLPLITQYPSVPSLDEIEKNPEPWFTYMSPTDPLRLPNRTIDYIFYSENLQLKEGKVVRGNAMPISDHLPVVIDVLLPNL